MERATWILLSLAAGCSADFADRPGWLHLDASAEPDGQPFWPPEIGDSGPERPEDSGSESSARDAAAPWPSDVIPPGYARSCGDCPPSACCMLCPCPGPDDIYYCITYETDGDISCPGPISCTVCPL